jgi:hypothetical protein
VGEVGGHHPQVDPLLLQVAERERAGDARHLVDAVGQPVGQLPGPRGRLAPLGCVARGRARRRLAARRAAADAEALLAQAGPRGPGLHQQRPPGGHDRGHQSQDDEDHEPAGDVAGPQPIEAHAQQRDHEGDERAEAPGGEEGAPPGPEHHPDDPAPLAGGRALGIDQAHHRLVGDHAVRARLEQLGQHRGDLAGQRLEALERTGVAAVLRGGRHGGGDGPGRAAADAAEAVRAGQLRQGERVDDAAGDAALHHQVAFQRHVRPAGDLPRPAVVRVLPGIPRAGCLHAHLQATRPPAGRASASDDR